MEKHVIIDMGHGGMINGIYQTPGKRSPKWKDLPQLFEGVQNREIGELVKQKLTALGIGFTDIVNSQKDVSRPVRIQRADACHSLHPNSVGISIHADAACYKYIDKACTIRYDNDPKKKVNVFYYKEENHPASGFSVYTSKGETKSDLLAETTIESLELNFGTSVKWRFDKTDGDKDKEENFDMVALTKAPFILCELGFMTNRAECELMHTQEFKEKCADALVKGILKYYDL